jgi:hypothetical protein
MNLYPAFSLSADSGGGILYVDQRTLPAFFTATAMRLLWCFTLVI